MTNRMLLTDKWEQLTPVFENGVFQYKYLLNGKEYAGDIRQKTLPNGKPFRGGDYNWEEPEGTRDGVIDDKDEKIIGSTIPRFNFSLNLNASWKGFDLSMFWQGVGKADGYLYGNATMPFIMGGTALEMHKDY